jgi:hypothetical protein
LLKRKFLQIRFRSYFTTQGLQHPDLSSWHDLYANGSDINLLNTISLTRAAFEDLLASFSLYYSVNSGPGKSGRPRKLKLKSTHCIGTSVAILHCNCGTQNSLSNVWGSSSHFVSSVK